MFDLTSFIRQLFPPHRRQPLAVALARVLFGPAQVVMDSLVASRVQLLDDTRITGQTLVLEDLLTRAIADVSNTTVYIAEGNSVNYDFTVVVPSDVPTARYGALMALINRYKQAGKRYQISTGVRYDVIDNGNELAWAQGYPYISGTRLYWAINKQGTYYTRVTTGDTLLVEDNIPYLLNSYSQLDIDPAKAYLVEVGRLSKLVQIATKHLDTNVGYDWNVGNGRTLFLAFNASEPPVVEITRPDGTKITQQAGVFGVTFAGISYGYRVYVPGLPSGLYRIKATLPGVPDYAGYLILSDSNTGQGLVVNGTPPVNNQAPIINRQAARQVATVGTGFSQIIPADTFIDNDGVVSSIVSVLGVPDGLTFQINGLVVTITGTPTLPGDFTVRVTVNDDKGATALMQYVIAVGTKPVVVDPTPVVAGATTIDAPARPDILDLAYEWRTVDGQPMAWVWNRANPQPSGGRRWYFFLDGYDVPFTDAFPGAYIPRGTYGQVYAGLGTKKEIYHDGYSQRAQQQFYIGNPPS